MSTPFVTALIDTYNHEAFIEAAIESALEQDFPPSEFEILVVDDGSTDRTPEIVRRFEPRVRLLRKTNGGQASAFNAGIPEARGEIVAFLDGDDWWAPGKVKAVAGAFASNPSAGLVGHGIVQVGSDGRQLVLVPREPCRFRIASTAEAKMFRTRRGFLGTSRMAYRKETLRRIGAVPEALKFEADEYLFTLAGLFADVMILCEPLTFYRLHDRNLFQLANANAEGARAKQQVLAALAKSLGDKFTEYAVSGSIAKPILECVQAEADVLRLSLDSGYPWETVSTEWKIQRALHSDASVWQHLFSFARLVPAFVMPAAAYYGWRRRLSRSASYRNLRRRFFRFPVPRHIEQQEKPR
ncbi:MAG TPA: glycosyltransferase family A protein [Candidatus Acidoferrum sp.]|nr:glycosyltransferase family A protein [Candidatus Acidoferrum sp.]